MEDYYATMEQAAGAATFTKPAPVQQMVVVEPQQKEEESKELSMLCNESLQIPKAFPFSSESNFTKTSGFFEPPKQAATAMIGPPVGYQVGPIKIPVSRFNPSPEGHQHMRRVEHPPQQFETPKRFKRRVASQVPQAEKPASFRGLNMMDPYSIIFDDMAMLHNPEYSRSEKYQQTTTTISEKVKRWVKYEYFYSGIDKPYFEKNELQECLSSLGIPYKCLRRADFILIRKAIGKPRRLSAKFLGDERHKLQKYREIARELIPYIV